MASVVTRKIPEIVLVDKEQLGVKELFTLNMLHKTDVSEFVICPHQRETIYLNKSFERAEDLIPIINGFMEQEWCNSKGDKLYKQFEDIAGEKAVSILSAIWQDWRKERMKANAKEKADEVLKRVRKRHIRQTIGEKLITAIVKLDCQKIINQMVEDGKKHSTMTNLKSCLTAVFESAVDEDVILKNPARNLQIPQTEVKKRVAMDPEQIKLFMEYVRNSPQYSNTYPEFLFLFNTGVRVGEMAGLTWDNIDFENNVITINKTVNRYRKKDFGFTVALASPKSRTSIRTFPMNDEVRKMFLKEKFRDTPPAAPLPFVDDSGNIRRQVKNIVFSNSFGNAWNEPGFLCLINRIIEAYNREAEETKRKKLENFCPHMARHTYTSFAYSAGADVKAVSEILGHASTSVTLDTYAHLTDEKKRQQEEIVRAIKVL